MKGFSPSTKNAVIYFETEQAQIPDGAKTMPGWGMQGKDGATVDVHMGPRECKFYVIHAAPDREPWVLLFKDPLKLAEYMANLKIIMEV